MPVISLSLVGIGPDGRPGPKGTTRVRSEDVRAVEDDGLGERGLDDDGRATYRQSRVRLDGVAEPILVALGADEVAKLLGWE